MAETKTATYTPEQTVQVLELYQQDKTPVEIGEILGKSARSVIAKLSREGVYRPLNPTTTRRRRKKSELVTSIATHLGVNPQTLESFEKATHEALEVVEAAVAAGTASICSQVLPDVEDTKLD